MKPLPRNFHILCFFLHKLSLSELSPRDLVGGKLSENPRASQALLLRIFGFRIRRRKNKLVMSSCLCFCRRSKRASSFWAKKHRDFEKELAEIRNTKQFRYKELRRATNNFSFSNKIGEGGFGSVYKGRLKDGTPVAIKVLATDSRQGVREFVTEINVIAVIEHENLVKLHGCCMEGKHRILVYGYLENNSIAWTLLERGRSDLQFSWHTRRKICIGVAKGLAFLHEEVQPHIIHRDIKASNILLDKDLSPKISDFGLAKLFPTYLTHISTRVAGTAGYLAPEYAIQGQLTRKADVYSFGVLLLEIISGRTNTNRRLPPQEQYLLEKAWELYNRGELGELVDASLNADYNVAEANRYLKIGLMCVQESPKLRPSMSRVVKMFMGIIDVDRKEITRPGLLSELMSLRGSDDHNGKKTIEKFLETSSSSSVFSCGTMTFNSLYDRTF